MKYYKGQTVVAHYPNSKYLTHGKEYIVTWVNSDEIIQVRDDAGRLTFYSTKNFSYQPDIFVQKSTKLERELLFFEYEQNVLKVYMPPTYENWLVEKLIATRKC
jgi:hypothetical protein